MKKFLSLALCLCMILGVSAPAVFAAGNDVPTLYWQNTYDINLGLSIVNGVAQSSVDIVGKPGTTKIAATLLLEKQNSNGSYSTVASWTNLESYNDALYFSGKTSVSRGGYRLSVTAKVTCNGTTETVSKSTQKVY